ncbi:MAG: hypothetical protein J6B01_10080 [Ruminococcus sp.]|nr:hypothetical protein [Ruminococcus sp.]MBP3379585.1 hypothetical protein [Ruminococcus sp.]
MQVVESLNVDLLHAYRLIIPFFSRYCKEKMKKYAIISIQEVEATPHKDRLTALHVI